MPISGLVVVFEPEEYLSHSLVEQLASHPKITVGERGLDRVAVVLESESKDHDIELWDWIWNLPGVYDIKIAFVGFDEEATS